MGQAPPPPEQPRRLLYASVLSDVLSDVLSNVLSGVPDSFGLMHQALKTFARHGLP